MASTFADQDRIGSDQRLSSGTLTSLEDPDFDEIERPVSKLRQFFSFDTTALVSLVYLPIYFTPWLTMSVQTVDIVAAAIGLPLFIALYVKSFDFGPRPAMLMALGIQAICCALIPFHGAYAILNVYACSAVARRGERRSAMRTMIIVQIPLVVICLATKQPLMFWVPAVFFGVCSGYVSHLRAELEVKNAQLDEAQGLVRLVAQANERERIARDMHDLLGHTLTLIAVRAELAAKLAEVNAPSAHGEMKSIAENAREALSEVRQAVTGMRRPTLAAELNQARQTLTAVNLRGTVDIQGGAATPRDEAVLAMALREAVTNIVRHADATSCHIRLTNEDNGETWLSITDDGRGGPIQEGSGITGMRARLSAVSGRLEVRSTSTGTEILAILPKRVAL